jgi:hypothetical protein
VPHSVVSYLKVPNSAQDEKEKRWYRFDSELKWYELNFVTASAVDLETAGVRIGVDYYHNYN